MVKHPLRQNQLDHEIALFWRLLRPISSYLWHLRWHPSCGLDVVTSGTVTRSHGSLPDYPDCPYWRRRRLTSRISGWLVNGESLVGEFAGWAAVIKSGMCPLSAWEWIVLRPLPGEPSQVARQDVHRRIPTPTAHGSCGDKRFEGASRKAFNC